MSFMRRLSPHEASVLGFKPRTKQNLERVTRVTRPLPLFRRGIFMRITVFRRAIIAVDL